MADILIFEDNTALASYWCTLLEAEQHQVRCCSTVSAALQLVSEKAPDLLIADMLIKQNNRFEAEGGLTLLTKLKLTGTFSSPILGVSGFKPGPYAQATALDAAQQIGIDMALYKPIEPEQLLAAVKKLLAGY
ncbi:MAG: response regulator [Cyanobacteria bacterium P01_A01_bin.114]